LSPWYDLIEGETQFSISVRFRNFAPLLFRFVSVQSVLKIRWAHQYTYFYLLTRLIGFADFSLFLLR
jgi:hypothetical protein